MKELEKLYTFNAPGKFDIVRGSMFMLKDFIANHRSQIPILKEISSKVDEYFPDNKGLSLCLCKDPESGESNLIVEIWVGKEYSAEKAFECEQRFSHEWWLDKWQFLEPHISVISCFTETTFTTVREELYTHSISHHNIRYSCATLCHSTGHFVSRSDFGLPPFPKISMKITAADPTVLYFQQDVARFWSWNTHLLYTYSFLSMINRRFHFLRDHLSLL